MFEQMKRAAALLAVGAAFSCGAWGQTLEQSVEMERTIAAEFFGVPAGRTVAERKSNPPTKVVISVSGADISAGNEADLTFSFTGATFVDRVSLSRFAGSDGSNVSLSPVEGGQAGDSWVTVRAAVAGGALAVGETIAFTVPDLQVAPVAIDDSGTQGAAVDVSIEVVRRTSSPFPDVVGDSANPGEDAGPVRVYRLRSAVSVPLRDTSMAARTGLVELMDRKVLTNRADKDNPTGILTIGLIGLAILNNGVVRALREDDSGADDLVDKGDFPGKVVVTVTGNLQTDDRVILTLTEVQRGEAFTRNEDGSYSGEITLDDLESSDAGGSHHIDYFPGGVDDLLPGTFHVTAAVRYDDELNASGPVEGRSSSATVDYIGVNVAAYAHGIVKAGGVARTYLRVACVDTKACTLFARCSDQAGDSYVGSLGEVAAGSLEVYDSDEIGEALGGGWDTGRGRCDLLSDGVLEVQNMLNQGRATVNNSVVLSSGMDSPMSSSVTILDRTQ